VDSSARGTSSLVYSVNECYVNPITCKRTYVVGNGVGVSRGSGKSCGTGRDELKLVVLNRSKVDYLTVVSAGSASVKDLAEVVIVVSSEVKLKNGGTVICCIGTVSELEIAVNGTVCKNAAIIVVKEVFGFLILDIEALSLDTGGETVESVPALVKGSVNKESYIFISILCSIFGSCGTVISKRENSKAGEKESKDKNRRNKSYKFILHFITPFY
jgi:hypothetical protein